MDLRQLKYFVAVAEELHFGRAAERVHIAQSPLSRQIRQLEESLGVALFVRTKRTVALTDAGRSFLPEARRVLSMAQRAMEVATLAESGRVGRLSIGFTTSAIYTAFPQVLARFRASYPLVQLELVDGVLTADQVEAILTEKLDLGLVRPPVNAPDIALLPFHQEHLVVALPEAHPLAASKTIEMAQLAKVPLIAFPRSVDSSLSDTVSRLCHDAGFRPNFVQEAGDIPTKIMLVSSGMGLALVPSSSRNVGMKGVVFRELACTSPLAKLTLAFAWKRSRVSSVRDQFLALLDTPETRR